MNRLLHWWIISAVIGVAVEVASAQTATNLSPRLSLSEARQVAFERNWDLLAARSGIAAAEAQLLMAGEFPNPNLSASTAKIGERDNSTPVGNGIWARSYDTVFAVNQLFEIGGKRHDRQQSARAGVLGAKARFFDAKRTLDQGVTKAYVAALLALENAKVLHESVGYMRREQEIAETRFTAGDLMQSDLRQIQVAAGQYALQETAADVSAVQARTALELLLGMTFSGDWQPVDSLEGIAAGVTTNQVIPTSGMRPDIFAAQADLQAAEANLKLQKAERIPDPTVSLQYEHNPPGGGPPTDTVGLGISFPLPLWNRNRGAIDAAQAAVEQSRIAVDKLRAQATADITMAQAAYAEASARWKRYRDQIAPQSASARESVIFKFNKGGAALVDLLEAQRTDNDVRLATAQAMADTINAAADLTAAQASLTEAEIATAK